MSGFFAMMSSTQGHLRKKVAAMSPTLVAEELTEQTFETEVDTDQQTLDFLHVFCTVCFTDKVSLRADGAIFCPHCGNTSNLRNCT
jgi:hypothetical protein